ncbi:uncharacterized protein FPRO_07321 [Fusarium proliferatum ET1]|uniref:Uncharacterized protein n=1 Tax=Fusarium proliferatum (strain ET1) TaxID=1227346 RepID=A0A1L7VTL2_FUSPR|nr:uncharacterized protein FPRO_07321 [Fusarium proliferatum ET1]CZR43762.1 uncharacterized protein FPRO_07321 [Fusarium proliferatum ET1]
MPYDAVRRLKATWNDGHHLLDQLSRLLRRQNAPYSALWCGSIVLCVMIAICIALSAEFGPSHNDSEASARGAVASVLLYSISYAIFFNAMVWTKGMDLAVATKAIVTIVAIVAIVLL